MERFNLQPEEGFDLSRALVIVRQVASDGAAMCHQATDLATALCELLASMQRAPGSHVCHTEFGGEK